MGTVSEVMTRNPVTVPLRAPISRIKRAFDSTSIWTLYVVNTQGRPLGVITRKDFSLRLRGRDPLKECAQSIMSKNAITLPANSDSSGAFSLFRSKQIHTIGVVDNQRLVGVITYADLIRRNRSEFTRTQPNFASSRQYPSVFEQIGSAFSAFVKFIVVFVLVAIFVYPIFSLIFGVYSDAAADVEIPTEIPTNRVIPNIVNIAKPQPVLPANPSSIYLAREVADAFDAQFRRQSTEFKMCLQGEKYGDGVLVTDSLLLAAEYSDSMLVVAAQCPSGGAGFIHSHPIGNCLLSGGDESMLGSEGSVLGVVCSPGAYAFYTTRSPKKTIPIFLVDIDARGNPVNEREITPRTPCAIGSYCNNECWLGCGEHQVSKCTPTGNICEPEPGYCPPGQHYCNGHCWLGCGVGLSWQCTSQGGMCE